MRKFGITVTRKDLEKEVELLRDVAHSNYEKMYDLEEDLQREREKCEYYQKIYNLSKDNYASLRAEYDKVVSELAEYKKAYNNQIK